MIKWIILICIFFVLGFAIGYEKGSYSSLNWCVEKAGNFINISVDDYKVVTFLMLYRNKIDAYIPNAFVFNNSRC